MSAFVVSKKHIDALLTYANRFRYGRPLAYYTHDGVAITFRSNLDEIGQKLWDENLRSVNYRYNSEDDISDWQETSNIYSWQPYHGDLTPVQIIKACDCWMYQSCETPDHETTEAWLIVQTIRELAISDLPGMEESQWEITQ